MKTSKASKINAYDLGYKDAFAATSWTLSGKEFDLDRVATLYALQNVQSGTINPDDVDRYITGFYSYCNEHSGTWRAFEAVAGMRFYCITADEAADRYGWGSPDADRYHVHESDGVLILINHFPESEDEGAAWACEIYRSGSIGLNGQGFGRVMAAAYLAALDDEKRSGGLSDGFKL